MTNLISRLARKSIFLRVVGLLALLSGAMICSRTQAQSCTIPITGDSPTSKDFGVEKVGSNRGCMTIHVVTPDGIDFTSSCDANCRFSFGNAPVGSRIVYNAPNASWSGDCQEHINPNYCSVSNLTETSCSLASFSFDAPSCELFAPGDVDADGIPGIRDAQIALYMAVDRIPTTAHALDVADFDNDGRLSASDALKVLRLALGLPLSSVLFESPELALHTIGSGKIDASVRRDSFVLSAVPDPGYMFLGWNGSCNGQKSCVASASNDTLTEARFAPAAQITSGPDLYISDIKHTKIKELNQPIRFKVYVKNRGQDTERLATNVRVEIDSDLDGFADDVYSASHKAKPFRFDPRHRAKRGLNINGRWNVRSALSHYRACVEIDAEQVDADPSNNCVEGFLSL